MILCYDGHMEWTSFAVTSLGKQNILLGFTWLWEHNLPRPKSMPRSTPMPRFKSKPRYPLYSSLVFCCSQAPISHHNPIDLPSLAKASFITHTLCDVSTDGDEAAAFHFQPHTPWQLAITQSKRLTSHHHFCSFLTPFLSSIPVSISLTLANPCCLVAPKSHDSSVLECYSP